MQRFAQVVWFQMLAGRVPTGDKRGIFQEAAAPRRQSGRSFGVGSWFLKEAQREIER